MPALAVTEHGNMFSAVVFHDAARKRGINPILGCEVYVAPGDRRDRTGHPGRDRQPPGPAGRERGRLQEPDRAGLVGLHRGLLLQAAHRQGAARPARRGPDRPQQLPEGRGRQRDPHRARQAGDGRGGQLPRHPRRRQLLPRDAVPGHRRAAGRQHRAAADRPRPRPAAGLHQRRPLPAPARRQAARPAAVHRHRQVGQRREAAAATTATSSSSRPRRRWPRCSATTRRRCATRWPSPSAATSSSRRASTTCRSSRSRPARRSTTTSSR